MFTYVLLRADGSVSELGYAPDLDTNQAGAPIYYPYADTKADLDALIQTTPHTVAGLPNNVVQVSAGTCFGAALTQDGNVWVWGIMGDTNLVSARVALAGKNLVKVAAGGDCLLVLDKQGGVWKWGRNMNMADDEATTTPSDMDGTWIQYFGFSPGDNNFVFHRTASRVQGIENATDIFCGLDNFYAIGSDVQGKPTGLVATQTNLSMQLSWASYPAAASYIIYRSLNEGAGYVAIGTSAQLTFVDANVQLGQTYYYEVSAVVSGVETSSSWDVSAKLLPNPTPVQNLTATWDLYGASLQWQPPTNAAVSPVEEYIVQAGGFTLAELGSLM